MAWKTRDVVWFENLLDAVYDGSPIDDGPRVGRDSEQFLHVETWVHITYKH